MNLSPKWLRPALLAGLAAAAQVLAGFAGEPTTFQVICLEAAVGLSVWAVIPGPGFKKILECFVAQSTNESGEGP
ncbi:hypothetical protein [Rugosimonospora africana]|uniref:Holin n=1 Tax=Rugosimonospora africana TaxID=556532 RepID=A0A8J3VVV4_9ACTN|nr:hypothetical protein [Rugosimonospora africana]GIH21072.1 hypothetical protein Raf01_92440 [Rugosimonospora africana]